MRSSATSTANNRATRPAQRHTLGVIAGLLLTLPAGAAPMASELPDIGGSASAVLTGVQERELGESFMRSIRHSLPIIDSPEDTAYIRDLGGRLAAFSGAPGQNFTFFLVDDTAINAFAGPGGYIGINTGLILTSENEGEVASVVAHEIAHVVQQHLLRMIEEANRMRVPAAAAMLAALVAATQGGGDGGIAALSTITAMNAQNQINFTRANEEEADRIGIQILAKAGYDPRAMPAFFEKLQANSKFQGSEGPEYLRTHPLTVSRIADTRNRAAAMQVSPGPRNREYYLERARLRVHAAGDADRAVELFRNRLKTRNYDDRGATEYGLALALTARGDYEEAVSILGKLLADQPEEIYFVIAMAQVQLESGNDKQVVALFEDTLMLFPGNQPLTLRYAEALLEMDRPAETRRLLLDYMRKHAADPKTYKLLSRATAAIGNRAESNFYVAEFYYEVGNIQLAYQQVNQALSSAEMDSYLRARMEARRDLYRQEMEDAEIPIPGEKG